MSDAIDLTSRLAPAVHLSQRAVDNGVRRVLARVSAEPERLAAILDELPEPFIAFTADRRIVTANAAAERFFGHRRRALDGQSTDTIVPARLRQPDAPPMAVVDDLTTVDLPALRADGSEVPTAWTFGCVQTPTGPVFVMLVRDRMELDDALEALHEREECLRVLVDGVREYAIFLLDAQGRIATWNASGTRVMGWPEEAVIGKPHRIVFNEEDRASGAPEQLLATARAHGSADATGWRVRMDGSRHFVESVVSALQARDGHLTGYAVIVHDLTLKLRAAESERLGRLHRLAVALATAVTPEDVGAATLASCLADAGAKAGSVYLIAPDGETLGIVAAKGLPPSIIERFRSIPLALDSPLTVAARTCAPLFYENRDASAAQHPPVREVILHSAFGASVALPLMWHGACIGALGILYRDARTWDEAERSLLFTTSQLCAQALDRARLFEAERTASRAKDQLVATLRESDDRHYALFEASPFPLALTKMPEGVTVMVNQAFVEMFDVTRQEVVGRTSVDVGITHDAQQEQIRRLLDGQGRVRNLECERRTKSGKRLLVSINMDRVYIGGVEHVLSTIQDISARKAQEEAEKRARAEAEAASRTKDEFLATMSHELRTPLNAILGWASILRADPRDPTKLARGIAVIERNAHAQTRIVNDLLDVSRIISGKLALRITNASISKIVHAAADVVRPSAEAKGVRLVVDLDPEVGTTAADPDRLQQVVWNLLSNAVRFTPPKGRVVMTASRESDVITLRVEDDGQGIPAEHLPHVFERFRQVDSSTTRAHGGLGLGLAIVRHLVEAHGGTVTASSGGPGCGATFTVRLPVRVAAVSDDSASVLESGVDDEAPPPPSRPSLTDVRVLVVDDEPDALDMLRTVLEEARAKVTTASSANAALDAPGPFDVVISDIGMPGVDGYQFMRRLREREKDATVPAIALTAYARAEDAERARASGYQEHVGKPVDAQRLLRAVATWARFDRDARSR